MLQASYKLFLIWFYFKCYPTFDVPGVLFDLHRSRAHRMDVKTTAIALRVL
ncbi:MAG: transposase family protein [Okeania sp. SIO2B9]|nr:transposase family protein [Okeania sp. SIO2B9]